MVQRILSKNHIIPLMHFNAQIATQRLTVDEEFLRIYYFKNSIDIHIF